MRAVEWLSVLAATTAGLVWALPAAGIGLTLGYALLGTLSFPRVPMPKPLLVAVVGACGIVAYLCGTRDLGIGYQYIPAVVPFLLLALAISSLAHGPRRSSE